MVWRSEPVQKDHMNYVWSAFALLRTFAMKNFIRVLYHDRTESQGLAKKHWVFRTIGQEKGEYQRTKFDIRF